MTDDKKPALEFVAMDACVYHIDLLDDQAQKRVLRYLNERYGRPGSGTLHRSGPPIRPAGPPIGFIDTQPDG